MDAMFSCSKKIIMLHLVTLLILMVVTTNAKIKGTFKCTGPLKGNQAKTCSTTNLPNVTDGSFDCPHSSDVSKGEACHLTCNDGFYPATSDQAVCEARGGDEIREWSDGNFTCLEIKCYDEGLPQMTNGSFVCTSGPFTLEGGACNLTCEDDRLPSPSNQIVCRAASDDNGGEWFPGNISCGQIDCNGWNKWNWNEYKYFNTLKSWYDSRLFCEREDAHLVTIENEVENDFVYQVVKNCGTGTGTWIGLNDLKAEGMWEWSDHTNVSYINWDHQQPDIGNQDCVFIFFNGKEKWHDHLCIVQYPYVCERNKPLN